MTAGQKPAVLSVSVLTIGAPVGNAISDGIAAIPQGVGEVIQVTAGCLAVLVALPFVLRRISAAG